MQIDVRSHVARKPHRCTACGDRIDAEDRYVRVVQLVDGQILVHKIHHYENPCDAHPNRSTNNRKSLL